MDTKYLKMILTYVLSAVFAVFVGLYFLFHLFSGFDADVETTPAEYIEISDISTFDAYIFRNEKLLYASLDGGVNYLCNDGTKVSKNTNIANIYSGSDLNDVRSSVIELDNKIDLLENSSIENTTVISDTETVDRNINSLFYAMRDKLETGNVTYALRTKAELLTLLNKRQLIVRTVSDFDDQIAALKKQKENLAGSSSNIVEKIVTDSSGYFYSETDGYEGIFTEDKIDTLSINEFENLTSLSPTPSNSLSIGKLVSGFNWYIVCKAQKSSVSNYRQGYTYNVTFPYSNNTNIKMTLYRTVTDISSDSALLIFKTDYSVPGFNYLRKQYVEISEESYEGIKVPTGAVRIIDGKKGVYILKGSVVAFKELEILTERDGYYIAALPDKENDEEYAKKLAVNDLIIVKGKKLYVDKVVK